MRIKFSLLFIVAFIAFDLVFSQLHEMTHMSVGRAICGCWGTQVDFNLWSLCGDCFTKNSNAYLATMSGPVFSYLMMYTGVWLLSSSHALYQQIAFILIVANKAFARLLTAAMGGGDETTVLRLLFSDKWEPWAIKLVGFAIVFLFAFPPLFFLYKKLSNKNKFWVLFASCSFPLVFQFLYEHQLLRLVLQKGFLAEQHFMGIADLVHLHTILMIGILIICGTIYVKRSRKQMVSSPHLIKNSD